MYDIAFRRILAELAVFHAVGATEQVTQAAESLDMPQSSVSRSLRRLGELLGIRLVVRSGRGVRLTEAGRTLLPYIGRGLAEIEAGLSLVQVKAPRLGGNLRLAFQNSLGGEAVPRAIRRYSALRPDVTYSLLQGNRSFCVEAVENNSADIALISPGVSEGSPLSGARLWDEPLVLVTGIRHRLAGEGVATVDMLEDETFIMLTQGSGLRAEVMSLCRKAGFEPAVGYEIDDAYTIRGLVSAGLGVSILPRSTASVPGVVEISLADDAAFRHVEAVWLGSQPSQLATEFITELRSDRQALSR